MAIKIIGSTIIDDSRNIVNAGIATVTSVSIGNTQVISSARQLQNIASLDATTTATIESAIQNAPNTFTDLQVTGISTLGVTSATNLTAQQLNVSGISTFTNGPVLIGSATSTGTASQKLQVTGGASFTGTGSNVGIGTTNPTSRLQVQGDTFISGVLTAVNGIRGIGIQSGGISITTGIITTLNFTGSAVSTITNTSGLVEINVKANQFTRVSSSFTATAGQTTFSVSYTPNYVDVFVNGVRLTASEYNASSGSSIILNDAAFAGDIIDVIAIQNGGLFDTSKWTAADTSNPISGNIYKGSGNVGIGTTNPLGRLQVGAGTSTFIVTGIGSVGIGVTNPTSKLTVFGDTNINNIQPTTVSYASSFSVAGQETSPQDVSFSNDGKTMYVMGSTGDDITWYTLSTPWDITTATHVSQFSVAGQLTSPTGLYFKLDGTKFYVVGSAGVGAAATSVNQYSCRTPWDLTTASYDSVAYSVIAQDTVPQGVEFKPDGTRMYVVGSTNDSVYQYSLSTPWDVSTVSYGSSFSVAGQEAGPTAIRFSLDGTKLLLTGSTGDDINYYNLSTPWDITTTSFVGIITSVGAAPFNETSPAGLYWKPDGTRLYLTGTAADTIYQFNMTSDADLEVTGKASVYGQLHIYESTTLYSDLNVNNIVGVGTTTTALKLKIQGDTNLTGGFNATGAVGIGTTNPTSTLHVIGNIKATTSIDTDTQFLGQPNDTVSTPSYSWTGDTTTGVYRPSAGNIGFTINGIERARITSTGNIGIGTTNPTAPAHIYYTNNSSTNYLNSDAGLLILNNGSNGTTLKLESSGTSNLIYGNGSSTLIIADRQNERVRITSSGNVGIGTTNPGAKLNVVDNSSSDALRITQLGSGNALVVEDSTNPDATPFVVNAAGSVGIGTTSTTVELQLSPTASISNVGFGVTLPGTVGSALTVAQFVYSNGNASRIRIKATRNTTGSDWTTASTKLLTVTDATEQTYIEFNPLGSQSGSAVGLAFGNQNGEWARFSATGNLGIGTTNPIQDLNIFSTQPTILFTETDSGAAADNKTWIQTVNNQEFRWQALDDTAIGGGNIFKFTRNGNQIQTLEGLKSGVTWFIVNNNTQTVGIGTTNPLGILQVGSAGTTVFVVTSTGSVGIGTTNPTAKLEPVDTAANPSVAPVVFIQRPNNIVPASIAPTNADLRIKSHSSNVKIYAEDHSANPLMILTGGGNLGIGTTNPQGRLHVGAASTQSVVITSTGSMVIGAISASAKLDVRGGANNYTPSASGTGLFEVNGGVTSQYSMYIGIDDQGGYFGHNGNSRKLFFDTNETTRMTIDSSGNVGIGTTNPQTLLQVGAATTQSVFVTSTGSVGIGTTNPLTTLQVQGSSAALDTRLHSVAEKTSRINGNTASLVYNTGSGNIAICTNPTGDITLNVTGIPTDSSFDNYSLTFSVMVNNTGTARTCTAVNLNGLSATIRWAGGSLAAAIAGVTTTNGIDIYSFTGINTIGSASTTANYYVMGVVNGGYR